MVLNRDTLDLALPKRVCDNPLCQAEIKGKCYETEDFILCEECSCIFVGLGFIIAIERLDSLFDLEEVYA